ncbi:hypothetical protein SBA4_4650015 [Candidatus Sulfopaludibacter sp. SbA4]|nr:hypothetical protein SBA4_4650015 [Candidatus Sulfopaludibacter sp. SbA4]
MPDLSTHKSGDLSSDAKAILEALLGRHLADDEEISIWASRPHAAPTGPTRREAWHQLNDHLDRMSAKAGGPAEEIEKLVDEVCDEVRHGPR